MDKGEAKAERGYPGPTRGQPTAKYFLHILSTDIAITATSVRGMS